MEKVFALIDEYVTANYKDLQGALETIGKQSTPEVLTRAATKLREVVCRERGVQTSSAETLQGELLGKFSAGLADPDVEAVRWVQEGNTRWASTNL